MRLLLDLATEPRSPLDSKDAHLQNCFLETDGTTVFVTKRPAKILRNLVGDATKTRGLFYTASSLYYVTDTYTLGIV